MHLLPLDKINTSALPDKNIRLLLWVTTAFGLLSRVQKEIFDGSELNTDIQGLHPGIVHFLFPAADNKVINEQFQLQMCLSVEHKRTKRGQR